MELFDVGKVRGRIFYVGVRLDRDVVDGRDESGVVYRNRNVNRSIGNCAG